MAKQKRWQYKRVLDQAVNDCSRAMSNLEQIVNDYQELHPEVAGPAADVMGVLLKCMESIQAIRDFI